MICFFTEEIEQPAAYWGSFEVRERGVENYLIRRPEKLFKKWSSTLGECKGVNLSFSLGAVTTGCWSSWLSRLRKVCANSGRFRSFFIRTNLEVIFIGLTHFTWLPDWRNASLVVTVLKYGKYYVMWYLWQSCDSLVWDNPAFCRLEYRQIFCRKFYLSHFCVLRPCDQFFVNPLNTIKLTGFS